MHDINRMMAGKAAFRANAAEEEHQAHQIAALLDNLADFNTGIDPGLPLAVYTRKQEQCQVFAFDAAVPISEATMVTTGTKHALACDNITMACW